MIFFTYPEGIVNNYAIINCRFYMNFKKKTVDYDKINEYAKKYRVLFLEPEVLILRKQPYYRFEKWLNVHDFLSKLPDNCYFSLDYPSDMNEKYTNRFALKTLYNIEKYNYSEHYIITTQSKFMDFNSFKQYFDFVNGMRNKSNILAIGNLCRLFSIQKNVKSFMVKLLKYIRYNINFSYYKWVHIYGLGLHYVKVFYDLFKDAPLILSFDSTKWTRACSVSLKNEHGVSCNKNTRQLFFNEYMKVMQVRKIPVLY